MTRTEHAARKNRESVSKRIGAKKTAGLKARDGHCCVYCGRSQAEAGGRYMHLDHVHPRHQGGADVVTNLVLACERCNSARGEMSLAQWAAYAREVYGLEFTPASVLAQAAKPLA
jgi:5-methylcytosine-specific restriction endonuclease McrA